MIRGNSSIGRNLQRGLPWPACKHVDPHRWDGYALFVPGETTPLGDLGAALPASRRREVHPAAGDRRVMPGHHPQPIVGVSAYTRKGR